MRRFLPLMLAWACASEPGPAGEPFEFVYFCLSDAMFGRNRTAQTREATVDDFIAPLMVDSLVERRDEKMQIAISDVAKNQAQRV